MKRPFEIGDRVRVYGDWPNVPIHLAFTGEVIEANKGQAAKYPGFIEVKVDGHPGLSIMVHPKQCRRLRPKPKPEKKEARRVWTTERSMSDIDKGRMSLFWNHQPALNDEVEFREVLPGEVVVTRETLAKAIQEYWQTPSDEPHTWAVCAREVAKALGLGVKP